MNFHCIYQTQIKMLQEGKQLSNPGFHTKDSTI